MRQNEREIKLIRVEDAVRTAGQLKREPTLVHFYRQGPGTGVGVGSCRSFADWMRLVYWVGVE